MATINELLSKSPGTFINLLLPTLQEAVALKDPYINFELAKAINDKQKVWGGGTVYENKSSYPLANSEPIHTDKLNTAIVQNFLKKLNNPPMSVSNAWLDFQKFVDLFYQMINPVAPFINTSSNRAPFPCPPDPQPCWNFSNFYTDAMGLYKRPVSSTTTEGTGFNIKTAVPGDGVTHSVVNVAFTLFKVGAPFPCPPDPQPCWNLEYLNNRYFALNSNGATDDWDVFWYDYDGTGVQPMLDREVL